MGALVASRLVATPPAGRKLYPAVVGRTAAARGSRSRSGRRGVVPPRRASARRGLCQGGGE